MPKTDGAQSSKKDHSYYIPPEWAKEHNLRPNQAKMSQNQKLSESHSVMRTER